MRNRLLAPALLALALPGLAALAPVAQAAPAQLDTYIVQVRAGANSAVEARAKGLGGAVGFRYDTALNGFSVTLPAPAAAALAQAPGVIAIERDAEVQADGVQSPTPSWGLDRIDDVTRDADGSYVYADSAGSGVRAYIIDTGIRATHVDFGARVQSALGYSAITDKYKTSDCNGHGTHVAGTVGGTAYGVAKLVTLVPVRVLNCRGSGTNSGVIAGIDFVAKAKAANPSIPMVANMSLGGGFSSAVNTSVANAVKAGVTMVVAAGNSNADACTASPASEPTAITVGATTSTDARASYSNFGTCVDIFAPGSSITSAWYSSNTATNTISGTSMASPHVAGAAALYLGANPAAAPAAVTSAILAAATPNLVTSPGAGSPNLLLYVTPLA